MTTADGTPRDQPDPGHAPAPDAEAHLASESIATDAALTDAAVTDTAVTDIEVVRDDLGRVRARRSPQQRLAPGEARLRVDTFALTANNITYAVFGDGLRYWDVFPAGPADEGDPVQWGRVPVWGFAEVIESASPDVAVGERLYGYLPMSNELIIAPGRADERGVTDTAAHRAGLAGAYNRYTRCAADPIHRPERERLQMVMFPLFFTSFVIDDQLSDHRVDGVPLEHVVISSASSKTSIGVAFLAHQRGVRVTGLTSDANLGFVRSLGVYDEVRSYAELDPGALDHVGGPAAYVDVAGNPDVRRSVHDALTAGPAAVGGSTEPTGSLTGGAADRLVLSLTVGGTHWDHRPEVPVDEPLPGPEPMFFFAPTRIAERTRDWGRDGLDARIGEAWDRFTRWAETWIQMVPAVGADEVTAVYLELLGGRVDPRHGHVCSVAARTQPSPGTNTDAAPGATPDVTMEDETR